MLDSFIFFENIEKNNYKWFFSNQWEDIDVDFFAINRAKFCLSSFKQPIAMVKNKAPQVSQSKAKWILKDKQLQFVGLAECQIFLGKFSVAHLFIQLLEEYELSIEEQNRLIDSVANFISGIFIMASADVIYVYSDKEFLKHAMSEEDWGTEEKIWIPNPMYLWSSSTNIGIEQSKFSISSQTWHQHPRWEENIKTLNYLNLRRERLKEKESPCTTFKKRPRGLLQRIFQPRV